jgi:hypothetical protein
VAYAIQEEEEEDIVYNAFSTVLMDVLEVNLGLRLRANSRSF